MKACVLYGIGDLRVGEVDMPNPTADEVLVKVRACGICGSDIPRIFTKGTYRFPTIPGHEFSGEIVKVGKGVDSQLMGRKVAVFPLIPCRKCSTCEIGEFALCEHYDYMGSRRDGAFAEYICSPVWNLVLAPDHLSFEEIAMVEPAAVAVHALRQARIEIGDQVLILGAGPIGIMLALWAQAWGASSVMLTDIDEKKLEFARKIGFPHACNPLSCDLKEWILKLTGRGADLVVEGTGSSLALENCLNVARPLGRVVLMGNPVGRMNLTQDAYWQILRKQLSLHGTWNSSFSHIPKNDWKLTMEYMASGKLRLNQLVTHRAKLDDLFETMKMMRDRKGFFNKVMYINEN